MHGQIIEMFFMAIDNLLRNMSSSKPTPHVSELQLSRSLQLLSGLRQSVAALGLRVILSEVIFSEFRVRSYKYKYKGASLSPARSPRRRGNKDLSLVLLLLRDAAQDGCEVHAWGRRTRLFRTVR